MIKQLQVFLEKRQLHRLELVLVATLVASMLEMVGVGTIPAFVGLLINPDRFISALPEGSFKAWTHRQDNVTLALYGAGLMAGLFLVKNVYLIALTYAETRLTQDATASVSTRLFGGYLYRPFTFHLHRNPAELIRNLTEEVEHAVLFVKSGMRLIREGLILAVVLLLLMWADPLITFLVFALLALASGVFYFIVRMSLRRRGQVCQDHWSRQLQVINQSLGAIKEAKILGREPYLMELFCREVNGLRRHETFYEVVGSLPRQFLEVLSVAAILPITAAFLLLGRPIPTMLPILALFGVAVARLVPAITSINTALVDLRYKRPTFDLVCVELESVGTQGPDGPRTIAAPSGGGRMQNAICLDKVYYRYPGAPRDALREVSLKIEAGEVVGFIGISGAGKSTLIDVILGLLIPTSGTVSIDGHNIHQHLSVWQRQIGYIPQDVYLIDDSIRRNVAFGLPDDEISDVAVARALRAAQIDDFVRGLPEGLETSVGNRGIRLSGGQRQRLGIARALYHDPGVLVMDEATSSLDDETERDVIAAIGRLREDRTVIMIAHRLTTVMNCDRLYLFEAGRMKDQGSFKELVARHVNVRGQFIVKSEHHLGIA